MISFQTTVGQQQAKKTKPKPHEKRMNFQVAHHDTLKLAILCFKCLVAY